MPRGFSNIALDPIEEERDKELTLGPAALTGLAVVLCGMCGVCFFWGYSVGHHGAMQAAASLPAASGPSGAQLLSQAKPAPNQAAVLPAAQTAAGTSVDGETGTGSAESAAPVAATYPSGNSAPATAQPAAVVQTALQQPAAVQPAAAAGQVQSALGQGTAWMVQIAAVSHTEDADVLVGALRKRGYVVSARRDPADDLLHVQVGPFKTHADAASMRQRLLNDGYNAIIEP